MPVTVLLTGLNGFVAVHTAVTFLSQGSKVIGTVRSEDKKAKAEGRYLIAGEDYTLKQILDTTRKVQPDLQKYFNRARESVPPEASYVIDSSKNGLRYPDRTLEETIRDSVAGFEKLCAYGGSVCA